MRDRRGRSPDPKPIGDLLSGFGAEVSPQTPLAAIQMIWGRTVGEKIAAVTDVVDERDGVVTVECKSSVWAQELEMMAPRILSRLAESLGDPAPQEVRFRAGG